MDTTIIGIIISLLGVALIASVGFSARMMLKRMDSIDTNVKQIDTNVKANGNKIESLTTRVTVLEVQMNMIIPYIQQRTSHPVQYHSTLAETQSDSDSTPTLQHSSEVPLVEPETISSQNKPEPVAVSPLDTPEHSVAANKPKGSQQTGSIAPQTG